MRVQVISAFSPTQTGTSYQGTSAARTGGLAGRLDRCNASTAARSGVIRSSSGARRRTADPRNRYQSRQKPAAVCPVRSPCAGWMTPAREPLHAFSLAPRPRHRPQACRRRRGRCFLAPRHWVTVWMSLRTTCRWGTLQAARRPGCISTAWRTRVSMTGVIPAPHRGNTARVVLLSEALLTSSRSSSCRT